MIIYRELIGINISMIKYQDIRRVHVELTTHCNARCPLCVRNFYGSDHNGGYPLTSLSLSDIQKILPVKFVQQLNNVYLGGNFGDFVMAKDMLEIVNYFKESNPNIKIVGSTNGGIRPASFWEELAKVGMEIFFCIDGVGSTHSLYRIDTEYDTVIQNATSFISAGGYAIWIMTEFDHNINQIDVAKKLAHDLKFREFRLRNTGRDNGPVYSKSGQPVFFIGKNNWSANLTRDQVMQSHNQGTAYHKRNNYGNETPATKFNCEVDTAKSIYIDALGDAYPCCYIGHYPKTYETTRMRGADQITEMMHGVENNALTHGIEHAISWFNKVSDRFDIPTFSEGRLYRCHNDCGIDK